MTELLTDDEILELCPELRTYKISFDKKTLFALIDDFNQETDELLGCPVPTKMAELLAYCRKENQSLQGQVAALANVSDDFSQAVWQFTSGYYVNGKPALDTERTYFEKSFENPQAAYEAFEARIRADEREKTIMEALLKKDKDDIKEENDSDD